MTQSTFNKVINQSLQTFIDLSQKMNPVIKQTLMNNRNGHELCIGLQQQQTNTEPAY